jgi:hypothetical protein
LFSEGVIFSLLFFSGLANYFRNWKKKGVSAEPLVESTAGALVTQGVAFAASSDSSVDCTVPLIAF